MRFESIFGEEEPPFAVLLRAAKAYLKKSTVINRLPQNPKSGSFEKRIEAMLRIMISPRGRR
jgi:hypothetical protein